eukprot:4123200-Amphidinium_carterae.1
MGQMPHKLDLHSWQICFYTFHRPRVMSCATSSLSWTQPLWHSSAPSTKLFDSSGQNFCGRKVMGLP